MTTVGPEQEELVYAAAVVILSSDLYPRKLEVVREYIQNASDALDSFASVADVIEDDAALQIKISIQGRSLLIWDNGIGMDAEEISKLRRIAFSEKREGEEAGYKGIGRLAGIAVANKLLISSTSYGDPRLHKFEFRAKEFREDIAAGKRAGIQEPATVVIRRHTDISEYEVDAKEHYTMVELREVDEAHSELLDPSRLREFIGDIAPVGFAPNFSYGGRISAKLFEFVPDYSPKVVWLTTASGDRIQIYKPYSDEMSLAEPQFYEVMDSSDGQRVLAYCWCATRGKEMLGKVRPAGGKFVVQGGSPEEKKRFAGLVYKLFGFSIGDRSLTLRTLWKKDYTRPLWFTGEIHIVDKSIKPTTDRSDFIDNEPRERLYAVGEKSIAKKLNLLAQVISNTRQAHDTARNWARRFEVLEEQLDDGGIERAEVKARREELHAAISELKRDCKDKEVQAFVDQVARKGKAIQKRLEEAKARRESNTEISDLARELGMTSLARKVYTIIMEALEHYYREDKDTYYEISAQIKQSLKRKY